MVKVIKIAKELGENVVLRIKLRKYLESINEPQVILDFSNVEFVSRSCMDEYLRFKRENNFSEENVNPSVRLMMEAVDKSRT